jgi:opacity protein-like surface antigen
MKRWALICGAMLVFAGVASAQDETPKVEVFGGYSFLHVSDQGATANFNGGSGSFSYNPNPWLGVVGDFGGYHWSSSGSDANVISYLFGPKIAFRRGRITPFVQTLFGGAHVSGNANGGCSTVRVHREGGIFGGVCGSASENAFAMALGGGLDWNATPHIGVRLIQAEYVMTKFNDGVNNRQNNARISAGVVFRF